MDGSRFDQLVMDVASSRRSIVRGAAGGGFLSIIGAMLGRKSTAAAAITRPVTCTWEIEVQGTVGPNKDRNYNGIMTVTVDPDGSINDGSYVLVDENWVPQVDSEGNEIAFTVIGSSHIRSIDFRIEHDGCLEIDFTGVSRHLVTDCKGPMSGSCHGPELVDHGGWRTRRTEFCPVCRGTACPPNTVLDPDTCECEPECPGGMSICGNNTCVPDSCPKGRHFDEKRCDCVCDAKTCKSGDRWCPVSCNCIPTSPCSKFECPKGYVHHLVSDGICTCVTDHCDLDCSDDEKPCFNGDDCACIPKTACKKKSCSSGTVWDQSTCDCVPSCKKKSCSNGTVWDQSVCDCVSTTCEKKTCSNGTVWDQSVCDCVTTCKKKTCIGGSVWDESVCDCVQTGCEPQTCQEGFEWNPNVCGCTCAEQFCTRDRAWDFNTCSCECVDLCGQGFTLNTNDCSCMPDNQCDPCFGGQDQNPETCECFCADGCPVGMIQDPNSCICFCDPNTCGGGPQDPNTCECFCDIAGCPENFILIDCQCVQCGWTCGEGQFQNEFCDCVDIEG